MSDVATDAYREILKRVSAESLPSLRRVCKEWKQIIDEPSFFEQIEGGDRLIICERPFPGFGKFYSLSLRSLNYFGESGKIIHATKVKKLIRRGVTTVIDMPVPSCHGLVLLCPFSMLVDWVVWNPFTKEFIRLPSYYPFNVRMVMLCGGIGYDVVSEDYNVVRVSVDIVNHVLETLIYSLKFHSWHRIDDYPICGLADFRTEIGVYFKGAIYFFARITEKGGSQEDRLIMALDLGSKEYRELPAPLAYSRAEYPMGRYLDASGGSLFLSYSYGARFDVWVLKDLGAKNIWEKFISLDQMFDVGINLVDPRLISYYKSNNVVVIKNNDALLWFDVKRKRGTKVSIRGFGNSFRCQAFPLGLVRLSRFGHANDTNASNGTLKTKRTSPRDRLDLMLNSRRFQVPPPTTD